MPKRVLKQEKHWKESSPKLILIFYEYVLNNP